MNQGKILALLVTLLAGMTGIVIDSLSTKLLSPTPLSYSAAGTIAYALVGLVAGALIFRFSKEFVFPLIATLAISLLLGGSLRAIFNSILNDRPLDFYQWILYAIQSRLGYGWFFVAPTATLLTYLALWLSLTKSSQAGSTSLAILHRARNHWKKAVALGLSISLLFLCSYIFDSRAISQAKLEVESRLKDPDSAKYRNLHEYKLGIVCGELNAKNSLGGYPGYRPFIYRSQRKDVNLNPDAREIEMWCTDQRGDLAEIEKELGRN